MKNSIFVALAMTFAVFTTACTQENTDDSKIEALQDRIREIEKENDALKEIIGDKGIKADQPIVKPNDDFLKNFCSILAEEDPTNTLTAYAANKRLVKRFTESLERLKQKVSSCTFQQKVLTDFPFDIAEYKTDEGYLYVQAHNSKIYKIQRFLPLNFEYQLKLSSHDVETRDGEKLKTWVIYRKDGTTKKGAIFMRSPYMVYGGLFAQGLMAMHYDKILVLQSNRGSHNSTGHFKWLHPHDIDDSYDSLEWISKLPTSNGKVMAFGVSYDGYNALGSAASNHPALKSVIACSAPANAATDSFTANKFVENGIFSYVTTDRRNPTVNDSWEYREFVQTAASKRARSAMDDILLGFDSEEWNTTSEAIDNQNHPYWKERQLLDVLHNAKMPIAHVAGLVRDQDGRDTYLGFKSMNEYSKFKGQNFLALHGRGHGCGDFFSKVPLARKLVDLTSDDVAVDLSSEKRVALFSKGANKYLFDDKISNILTANVTFDIPEDFALEDALYQREKDSSLFEKRMLFTFKDKVIINGVPKMKIYVTAEAPEIPVHVNFFILTAEKEYIHGTLGWRTAFITSKINEVEHFDLIFPPVNGEIPAGSILNLVVSTDNKRTFARYPEGKMDFDVEDDQIPSVKILTEGTLKSSLKFQIEPEPPIEVVSPQKEILGL